MADARDGAGGGAPVDAQGLLATVRELWSESHPGREPPAFTLDSRLDAELGLDSLHRVELALRLERAFGRRLGDEALASAERLSDVLEALQGARGEGPVQAAQTPAAGLPGAVDVAAAGPVDAPRDAGTLQAVLAWHVSRQPRRTHIRFLEGDGRESTLDYATLDRRARQLGAGLQQAGLEPGQACALMLPSGLAFFVAYLGILLAGGVPVPIYPPMRASQIEEHLRRQAGILANCRAVALITVPEAKLLSRLLQAELPALRRVSTPEALEQAGAPRPLRPAAASPEDIAFIQYTSGSTGSPKGVVLTHANLLANVRAMGLAAGARPEDVFVSWLPLYHDMGLIGAWMSSLYFGLQLVLMSPLSFLARPARWLQAIHRYRGTVSAAPNFAYELCASRLDARELEGLDLSSWRWAFNGAEAVDANTLERFARRFAPYGFDRDALAPVYGLAECALDLTFPQGRRGVRVDTIDRTALRHTGRARPLRPGAPAAQQVVACGRVLPGYALRIADARGAALPERQQGRVQFQGPSATRGYFDNAEATAALRVGPWLDSGDLGYLAEGELYVTGRRKDLIIRAGHNIHPHELEAAVGALPGVRKGCVAVLGIAAGPGAAGTERLVVVAETREREPARRTRLEQAIQALATELTGAAADDIVLVPPQAVLKTSSGKIRRAATREAYLEGRLGAGRAALWLQLLRLGLTGLRVRLAGAGHWLGARAFAARAWLVFALCGLAGLGAALLTPGLKRRRRLARRLARLGAALAGLRIDLTSPERLLEFGRRGGLVVANHASYADALVLLSVLPERAAFVAKGEFRRQPLMRWLLGAVGARFVERFDAAAGARDTRALAAALAAGEVLVFFPEGTFRERPGVLPFRMGAFVLAARQGLPVLPLGLHGTRALLPAGSWRPRPAGVALRPGSALHPDGTDWSAAVRLREQARAAVIELCGEPAAADQPSA